MRDCPGRLPGTFPVRQIHRVEPIVDPWVVERRTLVAIEKDAVVAGALVLRYGAQASVGEDYRDAAEVRWLVCHPAAAEAGAALVAACLEVMDGWRAARQYADGSLPSLGSWNACLLLADTRQSLVWLTYL